MPRPKNSMNERNYIWSVELVDIETQEHIKPLGKYTCLKEFNNIHNTDFTPDRIKHLRELTFETIEKNKHRPKSFVSKYGMYKFTNIKEPVEYEILKMRK